MKHSLLILLSLSSSVVFSAEKNKGPSCVDNMRVLAQEEINTDKDFVEIMKGLLPKIKITEEGKEFYYDMIKDNESKIAANEAFMKDASKAPSHFRCPDTEVEPIIHESTESGISSYFGSNEQVCTLTNTYDVRVLDHKSPSKFKVIATLSDIEKHIFMGDKQKIDRSFPIDKKGLANKVIANIDGFSADETKAIINKFMETTSAPDSSKISITSPKSGFMGFGEEGSWKEGKPSYYRISSAVANDNLVGSSGMSQSGYGAKAVMKNGPVNYSNTAMLGYSKGDYDEGAELTIHNTVNFVCANAKAKVEKNVDDSSRSNVKVPAPIQSEESSSAKTSSK